MNALLIREFQVGEVRKAIKQMHPLKALGLDDMNPLFYQHFWPIVGECVTKCVLDFLNIGVQILMEPTLLSSLKLRTLRKL